MALPTVGHVHGHRCGAERGRQCAEVVEHRGAGTRAGPLAHQPDRALQRRQGERAGGVVVGVHRVRSGQHDGPHVLRVPRGVGRHQVRPVGVAEEVDPVQPQRSAHVVEVVGDGRGPVVAGLVPQLLPALPDRRALRVHRAEEEVRCGQCRTGERIGPPHTAGVHQQQVTPVQDRLEAFRVAVADEVDGRGAGPSGVDHDGAQRGAGLVGARDQGEPHLRGPHVRMGAAERDRDAAAPRRGDLRDLARGQLDGRGRGHRGGGRHRVLTAARHHQDDGAEDSVGPRWVRAG